MKHINDMLVFLLNQINKNTTSISSSRSNNSINITKNPVAASMQTNLHIDERHVTDRRSRNKPKQHIDPSEPQSPTSTSKFFGSLVDYDITMDEDDWLKAEDENEFVQRSIIDVLTEVDSTTSTKSKNTCVLNSTPVSSETTADDIVSDDGRYKYANIGPWEKYSSGIPSKILNRMGFKGQGLGKDENGIREPIKLNSENQRKKDEFGKQKNISNLNLKARVTMDYVKLWPKGTTLITGDSILCGI